MEEKSDICDVIYKQLLNDCFAIWQADLVGVHDAEGFLELLDGPLREHSEDIATALLGFPEIGSNLINLLRISVTSSIFDPRTQNSFLCFQISWNEQK